MIGSGLVIGTVALGGLGLAYLATRKNDNTPKGNGTGSGIAYMAPGGVRRIKHEYVADILATLSMYNPSPVNPELAHIGPDEGLVEATYPALSPYTAREWVLQSHVEGRYIWIPYVDMDPYTLFATPHLEAGVSAQSEEGWALLIAPDDDINSFGAPSFIPGQPPSANNHPPTNLPLPVPIPGINVPMPSIPAIPGMPAPYGPGLDPPPQQGGPNGESPWPGGGYWFPPGSIPGMPGGGSVPTIPGTPPPAYVPPGGFKGQPYIIPSGKLPSHVAQEETGDWMRWVELPDYNPGQKIVDSKGNQVAKTSKKAYAIVPWKAGTTILLPPDW